MPTLKRYKPTTVKTPEGGSTTMSILRKEDTDPIPGNDTTCTFRYIGKAPARPDGTLMFRVRQVKFEVVFDRDDPFNIVDDNTPQRDFVLKCIRGAREYDWATGGQIKSYEEVV